MTTFELVVLAVALAMDAVAVSLAEGLQLRRPSWRDALLIAGMFGLFQGLMPVLGWVLAFWFADAVSAATPWIAFGLLALIGAHMIKESFEDEDSGATSEVSVRSVTPLAIATSIDAAAVGVTFGVLEVDVARAVVLIGVVTFALSLVAVLVGSRVGQRLGRWATLVGGLILVGIGLRILLDHVL
ncbi:MAG TPA: manganese efflux pump MntP family protein [Nocardioides sp.]|nr:manganese efflux pump MntP family protein [Nocardioides sp.]